MSMTAAQYATGGNVREPHTTAPTVTTANLVFYVIAGGITLLIFAAIYAMVLAFFLLLGAPLQPVVFIHTAVITSILSLAGIIAINR